MIWERNSSAAMKVRTGGSPDVEQKLPADQQRPTEEQAVLLQPTDTMQSRSPWAAMEEPAVQQWMRPEEGTAHREPPQVLAY